MNKGVHLIAVPFDSGLKAERMGRGPHALLNAGLVDLLRGHRLAVELTEVEPECAFWAEVATAFDLHRSICAVAGPALAGGHRPISLTGNCNTGVIGSLAASPREGLGLVWFDAHSDAETPESSASGFLDGMGLAIVLGRCWRPLLDSIPCAPVDGSRVALIGAREISAAAGQLLHESGVTIVPPAEARKGGIGTAVERLREAGVCRVHVHLDLDVLDPDLVGPANSYALPDGLSEAQLLAALRALTGAFEVLSASVASYDPGLDVDGTVAAAGLRLIDFLATA